MSLQPIANRVIASPCAKQEATTKGGIILTQDRDSDLHEAIVLAVGDGVWDKGAHRPVYVAVGDRIVHDGGYTTTIGGERVVILFEDNIIAKVTG